MTMNAETTGVTDAAPQTAPTSGAQYVWNVYAVFRTGDPDMFLGQIELLSDQYGSLTDAHGMKAFLAERAREGDEYLFREHALPVVDVKRFRVELASASDLSAGVPATES